MCYVSKYLTQLYLGKNQYPHFKYEENEDQRDQYSSSKSPRYELLKPNQYLANSKPLLFSEYWSVI